MLLPHKIVDCGHTSAVIFPNFALEPRSSYVPLFAASRLPWPAQGPCTDPLAFVCVLSMCSKLNVAAMHSLALAVVSNVRTPSCCGCRASESIRIRRGTSFFRRDSKSSCHHPIITWRWRSNQHEQQQRRTRRQQRRQRRASPAQAEEATRRPQRQRQRSWHHRCWKRTNSKGQVQVRRRRCDGAKARGKERATDGAGFCARAARCCCHSCALPSESEPPHLVAVASDTSIDSSARATDSSSSNVSRRSSINTDSEIEGAGSGGADAGVASASASASVSLSVTAAAARSSLLSPAASLHSALSSARCSSCHEEMDEPDGAWACQHCHFCNVQSHELSAH